MRRTLRRWLTVGTLVIIIGAVFLFPRIFGDLAYPVKYETEINAAAAEFNIEPALLFAIARSESNFRPEARSHAGALGLFQMLPGTGRGVARQLGLTNFNANDLFNPAISARLGAAYLRSLLDSYNQRVDLALMGYNGGPGAANRYLAGAALPRETNRYYQVVMDRAAKYREILAERATAAAAPESAEEKVGIQKAFLRWFNS